MKKPFLAWRSADRNGSLSARYLQSGAWAAALLALICVASIAASSDIDRYLFVAGGAATLLAFAAGRYSARRDNLHGKLLDEREKLHVALNSMSQGLVLFDRDARIIACNARYIEMYELSRDVAKPGCHLRDLIQHRKNIGSFSGDVDAYCSGLLNALACGEARETTSISSGGRVIRLINDPMKGGGWVASHEDITERQRLLHAQDNVRNELREQRRRLNVALNNMVQGLCMFDAEGRIVLCNERYISMMGFSANELHGMSLLELFTRRKANGEFVGDPSKAFTQVLAKIAEGKSSTNFMTSKHGRTLRVVDQPMEGGGWVATFEDITEQRKTEGERDRDREFLKQIIDNVPAVIVVKNVEDRRIILANRAAEDLWGVSRAEAHGKTLHDFYPRAQADLVDVHDDEALQSDGVLVIEPHLHLGPEAGKRVVSSKRVVIRSQSGAAQYLLTVLEDVTERKRIEHERDRDRQFLKQIINNVPATIIVKDARSREYVLVNPAGEKFFGRPADDVIGKTAREILPPEAAATIDAHDQQVVDSSGPLFFDEHATYTLSQASRYVTTRKLLIRDSQGAPQYLLGVIEDVTERKLSADRIAHLALHDGLTGLPNRAHFREQLENGLKWVHRGEGLAVLYLDLDKFKIINDTLGHPVGDEFLKAVAARIRGCLRDTDIVARLGGDEFAIVQLSCQGPSDVVSLVSRVQQALKAPFELSGQQILSDASIGIAMAPRDGTDPDELLKNADLAMYGAKTEGRGTYRFFEQAMDAAVKARRSLEFDLREALVTAGFQLHFQPVVSLREGTIRGCEALLRWNHHKRGMVPPIEFIPVAEETGLINQLGSWVLRTACEEAASWPNDIKVAVNVSPVQFRSGNLVQAVLGALAASGLPPSRLELEITESVLLGDDDAILGILRQLKEIGVRIAMDDFGTGYSSLSYLQRFPFDKIKIDRSFIQSLSAPHGSYSIVEAVISIAKSRGIVTTAEGVETAEQFEKLTVLGCTEMQGYFFSRAVPAEEVRLLMRAKAIGAVSAA